MDRRMATWDGYKILILLGVIFASIMLAPYGLIISCIGICLIFYQVILRVIFTGPEKRSPPFSDDRWDIVQGSNNGIDIYGFIHYQPVKTDLVVFIHGWQSSSEKFTERMLIFRERGFHTIAIDMRGHGMAPDAAEWTAGKVIQDTKILLDSLDKSLIDKIHFYGHSLGGFVCVGMHNERHQGWWKDNYGTLILESPMVAYSPIMEQMSGRISFMLPLLKKWALNGFNKIHPEVGGLEWKDIDIPNWGLPQVPILLLQAKNDTRLGRLHYDLIMEQNLDVESHLIDSLTHSKNRINNERDELIVEWIEKRMN